MSPLLITTIALLISVSCSDSRADNSSVSSCGNVHNISCPFYLKGHQHNCHNYSYELSCHNNRTVLQFPPSKYPSYEAEGNYLFYVEAINYENSLVRIIDSGLLEEDSLCSSNITLHPFSQRWYYLSRNVYRETFSPIREFNKPITFLDCPASVNSSARYIPAPPCSSLRSSYVVIGHMDSSEVENNCKIRRTTWVSSSWPKINQTSFLDAQDVNKIIYGVELPFHYFYCLNCSVPSVPSSYCLGVRYENQYLSCLWPHDYCDDPTTLRHISFNHDEKGS
ncbi:hypothetical protein ACET3Z_029236 [Daucus carota]